jgi:hypothetical protein
MPAPGNGSFITSGGTRKIPAVLTVKKVSNDGSSEELWICFLLELCFKILNNLFGDF